MSHNLNDTPRIYVADLASYNNGVLYGAWVDATDADTMRETIARILRGSKFPNVTVPCPDCAGLWGTVETCDTCKGVGTVPSAEEYAIHDYEGFGPLKLSEYEDLDTVAHMAAMIEEHGEAWALWADNIGDKMLTSEAFQDAYCGEYRSEEEYAEQLAEDIGAVNHGASWPNNCIDWEAAARDLFMDGYTFIDGHVFHDR